ncbi:MAG: adenosylmethionine--8-amino-7-oxononanoate transaminase [Burkholderiales bacterium]|jgi:adenosylmethionine-8-amino-7-oxononanoate aminotransferase|nr:adenosylmethionine--8-amino-7-oxononanoate transaminase [Burkholderiales bacterium]
MSLTYTWLPADKPDMLDTNLHISSAYGSNLVTSDGVKIYDAISSWWCKPLGHRHPLVVNSILKQLESFEHHIPANAYNDTIEELSSRLIGIFTQMDKVMYASDGSSAIEIAMKLSYETRVLESQSERSKFIALAGAYHGETIFALSVCGMPHYTANYQALIQGNYFINDLPYVSGCADPKWKDCDFDHKYWENFFLQHAPNSTALIIEPIVQGTAGLKIISQDFLVQLITLAKKHDLHIIADEIMVGLGRLGVYSVSRELLNCEPDLVCFGKNLTAGSIPMSAVVINRSISDIFRKHNQIFPHSHTHSCNALAACVANTYLRWLNESDVLIQVKQAEIKLSELMDNLSRNFSYIIDSRVIGAIAACELDLPTVILEQIHALAIEEQLYVRPIGNILYLMPPLYNVKADLEYIEPKIYKLFESISRL